MASDVCRHGRVIVSSQNVGAKAKYLLSSEFRVRITFLCRNLHDITNSIVEKLEVVVQLPECNVM